MKNEKTLKLCICALFAALTAVLSQISIPLPPIPINLATFSVFLAGALLGAKYGALSQTVYVLLGAIGVPVFSSFRGGIDVIVGPTGGYIVGYILAAALVGWIVDRYGLQIRVLVIAMFSGFLTYMICGTCYYMFLTKSGLIAALMACVVPFLIGDFLKMVLAIVLARKLRPILSKLK